MKQNQNIVTCKLNKTYDNNENNIKKLKVNSYQEWICVKTCDWLWYILLIF